ncbi:DUF805 domain-containing protein [Pediococcus argentinicus]|uniref:Zinc-ribbon domain-containing protein n=1 Tax=Pediococcus argentinicus TaxID=480391 RepID=A0A0R2N8U5_9LACO|nr:DUF805 domain-containing protein [Pediococcus argentinicus]KRO22249.1 hypothetical protein IV88_GL001178 [Pediococcus argentinicus]NKZ23064.1 DUF805 domain-containing protein [Pediococcus argentinicus]GEP20175.1 hypothetical protein LSA03_15590 [Pediococcus argentinicus]
MNNGKYCVNCGKEISLSTSFCPYCGASQPANSSVTPNNQVTNYQGYVAPGVINSTKKLFRDTFKFSGRMSRADYWWATLGFAILVTIVTVIGFFLLALNYEIFEDETLLGFGMIMFYAVIIVIGFPGISACVRRLHDANHSGLMYFISWIPLVGGLILLIFMCTEGTKGPNLYGPDTYL